MALKISLLLALVCVAALIAMSEAAPQRKGNNNDDDDITAKLEDAKKQFDDLADKMEALQRLLPQIHKQADFSRQYTGVLGLPPKKN